MRKKSYLFYTFMFLIVFHLSLAQYLPWAEGEAKSAKDPLYMEFQDEVHHYMPVNVKVYINDPLVRKEAKYAEISTAVYAYSIDGKKIVDTSGGEFRQTMEYDGQDTIQFAFRPITYPEQTSGVYVNFYKIKPATEEYPDTSSPDSEFFGYNCHIESSKLMCNSPNGCNICNYPLGTIYREFAVSESKDSITTPGRFDFVNDKLADKSINKYAVAFEKFSHASEKTVTNNLGQPYTGPVRYTLRLEMSPGFKDLAEQKDFQMRFMKQSYPDVHETSAPGGMTGGLAFEGIKYTPPKDMGEKADFEWADIGYEIMSELVPKGSGYVKVQASRYGPVGKGEAAAERDRFISEVKAFAASYSLSKGTVFKPNKELIHRWTIRGDGQKQEETTEDHYAYGTITDYFGHPLPYMEVMAEIKGNKYIGYTDEEGIYRIPLTGLDIKQGEEIDYKVYIKFSYVRDNKNYFIVFFRKPDDNYNKVQAVSDAKLVFGEHSEVNFRLDGQGDYRTNFANKQDMMHYSMIYYHTHEALDFVLKSLKEDMDYLLPTEILVGNQNKDTLFSPNGGKILISADDSSLSDSDRPKNREYHEFMHALMYDIYNAWPDGRLLPNTKNHDGFHNPSTGDSYLEGFAEFMALVISDVNKDPYKDIYAGFGSLEKNYKPWDANGFDEEFAVASLLWDIYDDRNEPGDKITLAISEIWDVLKVKRKDFYEYYLAFKAKYPKQANDIDELFKMHGFYFDTRVGDGIYNSGEPWKYINQNPGPFKFIDMSDNVTKLKWQPGFVIGKATNYNRTSRSSAVMVPNAFLKVKDDEVDFYLVKVQHIDPSMDYEYRVDRKGGVIYVQPLPMDEVAKIAIVPLSKDYTAKVQYEISNEQLLNKLQPGIKNQGFFDEHEFDLKPTGTRLDEKYLLFSNAKPTYSYEGDLGEDVKIEIDESDDFSQAGFGSKLPGSFLFNLLILGIFVVFGYFYMRSIKVRKSTHNILIKTKEWTIKAFGWIAKNGVPFLISVSKIIIELVSDIIKGIVHHSKKAYHTAKPHIKKAHENIKNKLNKNKEKKVKNDETKE